MSDGNGTSTFVDFEEIVPLLEHVAEFGERHLHQPIRVDVQAWQDGDFDVCARHEYGFYLTSEWKGYEILRYENETGRIKLRYVEENPETGEERTLVSCELES